MNSSNPQYYKSVVEGINQTLKKVESLPYLDDIKSRGNDILTRIENSGFMMPNQIIITGRFKKNN